MQETKEELKGVIVSKVSAIISKKWKKIKASDEKMKKYRDLYEAEKQQYEEALKNYQEDHMDEVEIINLHKRCNKTDAKAKTKRGAKANAKAGSKTSVKTASKAPRSGYHLFLREQLEKMTGEDRRNYCSIVSRRWKEIKEDPAMARQMKNEAVKPAKAGDDLSVGSMEQQTVTERSVAKKNTETDPESVKVPTVC